MTRVKPEVRILRKGGLSHNAGKDGRPLRFKPWLGDSLSFLYDFTMSSSIFSKKFGGDIEKHYHTLSHELADVHGQRVLELAAGSGSALHFLSSDNDCTGLDVSTSLLKQTAQRFSGAGFSDPEFYVASADHLPFADGAFDICPCIQSLNFFDNVKKVLQEIRRVLHSGGKLVCSVPVPERSRLKSTIRGVLHSELEWETISREHDFELESIPCDNGALLYFRAIKQRGNNDLHF